MKKILCLILLAALPAWAQTNWLFVVGGTGVTGAGEFTNGAIVPIYGGTNSTYPFLYWSGTNVNNTNTVNSTVTITAGTNTVTANFGLDFGYSTSLYSANTDTTNIYTQSTTNWPGPDNWKVIVNKINNNFRILRGWILTDEANISSNTAAITALKSSAITNLSLYVSTYSTNVTLVGVTNGIAYYAVLVPAGTTPTVTNTTQLFSSTYITTLTNWAGGFTGSNFIGSFSNIYSADLEPPFIGGGGTAVPTQISETLVLSTNNGTSWYYATNQSNFPLWQSNVLVSVVGDANTNYGTLTLSGYTDPSQYGVVVSLQGRELQIGNAVNANDATPLAQVQNLIAVAMASGWQGTSDTNGHPHLTYSQSGQPVFDMSGFNLWVRINGFQRSGTNFLLNTYATNFIAGWQLQNSTNLAGALSGFTTYTNYTLTTNSGLVTFTIPMQPGVMFFRIIAIQTPAITAYAPITDYAPTIIPSNSWAVSYALATNSLAPFNFGWAKDVTSNGLSLWKVWNSNGVYWVSPQ